MPDEEDEEEPLPEIEPLPKEAAEGSRYPKLTKAKTGRLKDAPLTGHIVHIPIGTSLVLAFPEISISIGGVGR